MKHTLEVCANSVQSAITAQNAGADRVELCTALWEAGLTPSYAAIKKAVSVLNIPVYVLIRPRGGDFVYSPLELEVMQEDISACRQLGVAGIVSGALSPDRTIDVKATQLLKKAAGPLPFTFHRAFDTTPDLPLSLEVLKSLGIDRVLTSGGQQSAHLGKNMLAQLVSATEGQIDILAGGGLRAGHVPELLEIGCREFHLSGNTRVSSPSPELGPKLNGSKDIPENDYLETAESVIRSMRTTLDQAGTFSL